MKLKLDERVGAKPARVSERGARQARVVLIALFALVLCAWIYFLIFAGVREIRVRHGPNGASLADDFAMFYSAALVQHAGGNPYDHQQLFRVESQVMKRNHRAILEGAERQLIRVGNPPLFFWALFPLTRLPFPIAAYIWMAGMYVLAGAGFVCTAAWLGWTRMAVPAALFLVMPQVVSATVLGNLTGLVLACIAVSLLLVRRYPFAAGLLLSLAWLKPQLALPVAGLLLLFQAPQPLRTLTGATVGTLLQILLTLATLGQASLVNWFHALLGYGSTISTHSDIASLNGAYYRLVSPPLGAAIEGVTVLLAAGLTIWWWRSHGRRQVPLIVTGWLWAAWFLATPYAHLEDQMLLLPPVLALLGRNASDVLQVKPALVLTLFFFSVLFSVASPHSLQLLWAPLVLITVCLALACRDASRAHRVVAANQYSPAVPGA